MLKDKTISQIPIDIQARDAILQRGIVYYQEADLTDVVVKFAVDYPTYERLRQAKSGESEVDVAFCDLGVSPVVVKRFYNRDRLIMLNNDCQEVETFNNSGIFDEKGIPACFETHDDSERMVISANLLGFRIRLKGTVLVDCHNPTVSSGISYPAPPSDRVVTKITDSSLGEPSKEATSILTTGKRSTEAVCELGVANTFSRQASTGAELVGVEITTAKFGKTFQGTAIGAIRPLFRKAGKTTAGGWQGKPHGSVTRIEAKPGFSIIELNITSGGRITGLSLHFSPSASKRPDQRYSSGWIGQRVGKTTKLTCEPGECVGVFGSWEKENSGEWPTTIRSLGMLLQESAE